MACSTVVAACTSSFCNVIPIFSVMDKLLWDSKTSFKQEHNCSFSFFFKLFRFPYVICYFSSCLNGFLFAPVCRFIISINCMLTVDSFSFWQNVNIYIICLLHWTGMTDYYMFARSLNFARRTSIILKSNLFTPKILLPVCAYTICSVALGVYRR